MNRTETLLEMLKASPNDSFLQFALALEHLKTGEEEAAERYFRAILETNPQYTGTYYHLGKLLERKGDKNGAEQTYRDGLRLTFGKEQHTYAELQQALNDLWMDDDL